MSIDLDLMDIILTTGKNVSRYFDINGKYLTEFFKLRNNIKFIE
jgi:hypothetical protein